MCTKRMAKDLFHPESPYLKYVLQFILVDTKNSKLIDRHMIGRYKPVKPSDSMVKMLRSIVTALQSMSEYAIVCDVLLGIISNVA
jgi:hypothetical protein